MRTFALALVLTMASSLAHAQVAPGAAAARPPNVESDMMTWPEVKKSIPYPSSSHAGIPDTSEMLYLGTDKGWVRAELVKDALGDPVLPQGQGPAAGAPRVNNGVSGDGRRSAAELGKRLFEMKVAYAVKQIKELTK